MNELAERLKTKAQMISLGEKIAWGSDSDLMMEAAEYINLVEKRVNEDVLVRYAYLAKGNFDLFMIQMERLAREKGHSSVWLAQRGIPETPASESVSVPLTSTEPNDQ